MGAIYVAFDSLAKREVAYKRLKVSSEGARPRLTALFEREYNALRQLKHPNIVEVYDYGLDAEGPFYTMELLAGNDLSQAAPLPVAQACRIVRDVASALALLHARRLVHRDVTPANVRLGQDGRAKLIDFGALSEFGVAKEIVGTPPFIAPECLAAEPLDARTDLFALGGLLYWALTRRHAYPARSIQELTSTWELSVVPPSQHVPGLPRELDELVLSLLEREAVVRPGTAAHVIERLTTIAELAPQPDEQAVAYSYLLHPPLVGRDALLKELVRYAAEAADEHGRAVNIEAASGLGRSALLDQVAVDAQLSGANVLRFKPSGKRDFGLAQTVVQWMRALFPALWSAQLTKHSVLARETRAPLVAVSAQSPGDVTLQRVRIVAAVQDCVAEMCKRAPVAILIDDVQRADAESLAILASLARTAEGSRLLLVVSQEERAQGADVNALADLRAVASACVLKPLSASDLEAMVETVFGKVPNSHRLARFLHAQSGGNPGQCMDLCRLLLEKQEIRYELGRFVLPFDPRGEPLGSRVLELTRLTGLSAGALALIRLLALHDSALSTLQAAAALACDEQHVLAGSAELAARGLIQSQEEGLSLASESLRSAIAESLSRSELAELHGALSKCLLAHGDGTIENKFAACHHLLLAGRDDEAIALVWSDLRDKVPPNETIAPVVPVLELLLAAVRKRGYRDEHCWPVLWPLVVGGFWGELGALNRHRDAGLNALANLTGIALAARLTPRLGKKLALIVGIVSGLFRFFATPKRFRAPSYADLMQRFFTAVTMSTATASSAFEPENALRIAALLDPIEAMKEGSPARVAREFALATAELGVGLTTQSSARYGRILALLKQSKVFDETMRENFVDGCVHGCAQADVSSGAPDALNMAEELTRRHPFFRPHVETIKMTFYGYRGERERAAEHRKQAEILALQGGLSWSAFTVLTFRSAYLAMAAKDTLGVLQASVEFERLSAIAPSMLIYRDLCHAYVALARGQAAEALAIYERCAALPHAQIRPASEMAASFQAEALAQLGRLEEAKRVCEESLRVRTAQGAPQYSLRVPLQQLALVEARRGEFARAKELLAQIYSEVERTEAPMQIGSVRRDQARVALLERDGAAFERYFEAMLAAFRPTHNPSLIQQCRKLLAEAERSGVVLAPNWEKHELMAPANTQELAATVPEMTELLETN
jgi:tetratricopeptide (TPR) repeat protein